jgi:hypothetical protein
VSRFISKTGLVLSLVGGFAALTILGCLLGNLIGTLLTARFDAPIVQYVAAHRVAELTRAMKGTTTIGNDLYVWIVVFMGGAILTWLTQSWRPLILLALDYAWRRLAQLACQTGGCQNAAPFIALGNSCERLVFPFWSCHRIRGRLQDSRVSVRLYSAWTGRQKCDLRGRNRSTATNRYFASIFRSALADGCHRRMGARWCVVGDSARLEFCRSIAELTNGSRSSEDNRTVTAATFGRIDLGPTTDAEVSAGGYLWLLKT